MPPENRIPISSDELVVLDCDQDNPLSEVIAQNTPACKQLDILVGYFYFNGIKEIRAALEQNPEICIRILVGMDAGMDSKGLVEYAQRHEAASVDEIKTEYRRQVKEVVAALGPENDNLTSKKILQYYALMIDTGRLLIRKASQPNHSKLYIFNQGAAPSFYIVGSSNFSRVGIAERQELNVQICRAGLEKVQELFGKLWLESVPVTRFAEFPDGKTPQGKIAEDSALKEPLTDPLAVMLTKETQFADVAPYDA